LEEKKYISNNAQIMGHTTRPFSIALTKLQIYYSNLPTRVLN